MGVIDIDKDIIPYQFDLELSNKIYTFTINYNFISDFFTVDLSLGDKILVQGEKIILDEVLFRETSTDAEGNISEDFPSEVLVFSASDNEVDRITFDNLGEDVQFYYITREEIESGVINE